MGQFIDTIEQLKERGLINQVGETIMKNGVYGKMEHDFAACSVDTRYNVPKAAPKASSELVEKTIKSTEIYRRARLAIMQPQNVTPESRYAMLQAQRKQVAYGIDKYPEPLNADTWSSVETIEHAMDESIDRLHYLIMLNIKLEQDLLNVSQEDLISVHAISYRIETVIRMIHNSIEEMDYLIMLRDEMEADNAREKEACDLTAGMNKDALDAIAYAVQAGVDGDGNPVKHSMMKPIQMGPWD